MPQNKISIVFFGITRSLRHTIPSIEKHVFEPARQVADVSIYAHFFNVSKVVSLRSGEANKADPDEYKLLNADSVQFSQPNGILNETAYDEIKEFGDHWGDNFASLSNLIHQLYSLKKVTSRALEDDPDMVIFCRPDIEYYDSFQSGIQETFTASAPVMTLPYWQRHKGGFNDRFAICRGERAIAAYGQRLDLALTFCQKMKLELHSERLLRYSAVQHQVTTNKLEVRGSRIRSNGRVVNEDFSTQSWKMLRNQLRFRRRMVF